MIRQTAGILAAAALVAGVGAGDAAAQSKLNPWDKYDDGTLYTKLDVNGVYFDRPDFTYGYSGVATTGVFARESQIQSDNSEFAFAPRATIGGVIPSPFAALGRDLRAELTGEWMLTETNDADSVGGIGSFSAGTGTNYFQPITGPQSAALGGFGYGQGRYDFEERNLFWSGALTVGANYAFKGASIIPKFGFTYMRYEAEQDFFFTETGPSTPASNNRLNSDITADYYALVIGFDSRIRTGTGSPWTVDINGSFMPYLADFNASSVQVFSDPSGANLTLPGNNTFRQNINDDNFGFRAVAEVGMNYDMNHFFTIGLKGGFDYISALPTLEHAQNGFGTGNGNGPSTLETDDMFSARAGIHGTIRWN